MLFRIAYIVLYFFLLVPVSRSQDIMGLLEIPGKFARKNVAVGYQHHPTGGMVVNLQSYNEINRHLYDRDLKLVSSYRVATNKYALSTSASFIPQFAIEVPGKEDVYEVYSTERSIQILKPHFKKGMDEEIFSLDLKDHHKDERRLAVMPYSEGLRVLSYSPRSEKLFLYQWSETRGMDTIVFNLPESSLSDEEEKLLTKYARIKYKQSLDGMAVSNSSEVALVANPALNSIFYSEHKIRLLSMMVSYGGYNVLELDIPNRNIRSSNFLINDMKKNSDSKPENVRIPYATVTGDYLVIRNSSNYHLEYIIYDLVTSKKIRSFISGPDENIKQVFHSDFLQLGTWFSKNDEKEIVNEKAFLRKLSSGQGFLYASQLDKDSITITTGSVKAVQGIEGLALGLASAMIMPGFVIGTYRVVFYLTTYRKKLTYAHTRFSIPDFQPSTSRNIQSGLDYLLENFESKDLEANSSFIIKKNDQFILAVFNTEKRGFELFRMNL